MSNAYFVREGKCPICGKNFVIPPMTVYKLKIGDKVHYYCGYTCFRTAQKKEERKRTEKKGRRGK